MIVKAPQDLLFGIFMIVVGLAALAMAWHLPMGSASQMGPGYMPRVVGSLCVAIGLLIAVHALRIDGPAVAGFAWRPLALVVGAILFFALCVEHIGLFLSVLATVGISMLAEMRRPLPAFVFAVALSGFCVLLFRVVLGMPMPIFPTF